ncbi:cytochrome P450 4d2-like [Ochlerotatus camptorhynchus]|uniref:cytochrome P450 4d2-like n=1 Tax=Ochlerotatus camptorhynchus TaxID=644619 RepID=UPI0031CEA3F1
MFFPIVLSLLLVLSVYVWQWRRRLCRVFRSIPGPPGLPLVGNTLQLIGKSSTYLFHMLYDLEQLYGSVYKLDTMSGFWLYYNEPEYVERIMTGPEFNCKSADYDMLLDWLGTGLLISNGNKWFTHRKALTPAFHFKILENFVPVFDEKGAILAMKFLSHTGGEVPIFPLVKLCTLDVIVETAMGTVSNAQSEKSSYTIAVEDISAIVFWRMFNVVHRNDVLFRLNSKFGSYSRCLRTIREFTLSIIEKRREALTDSDGKGECLPEETGDVLMGSKKKMALLDILLQTKIDGSPLTNEEIREEVDTFMFGGHDTTASAITFLLYSLAKHPDVQQKVYEEIISVAGESSHTPFTLSTLNDLKYLDLVIKESLRLFPPVPYISRTSLKEVNLGGVTIPANTKLSLGIYNMHHNPKYFPEPENFLPERFEAERAAEKQNPYAYVPFSAGGRNCIGQKFAQYELKSTISQVIRLCRVELPYPGYEPPLKAEMILKPQDDMLLKFFPR